MLPDCFLSHFSLHKVCMTRAKWTICKSTFFPACFVVSSPGSYCAILLPSSPNTSTADAEAGGCYSIMQFSVTMAAIALWWGWMPSATKPQGSNKETQVKITTVAKSWNLLIFTKKTSVKLASPSFCLSSVQVPFFFYKLLFPGEEELIIKQKKKCWQGILRPCKSQHWEQ